MSLGACTQTWSTRLAKRITMPRAQAAPARGQCREREGDPKRKLHCGPLALQSGAGLAFGPGSLPWAHRVVIFVHSSAGISPLSHFVLSSAHRAWNAASKAAFTHVRSASKHGVTSSDALMQLVNVVWHASIAARSGRGPRGGPPLPPPPPPGPPPPCGPSPDTPAP